MKFYKDLICKSVNDRESFELKVDNTCKYECKSGLMSLLIVFYYEKVLNKNMKIVL